MSHLLVEANPGIHLLCFLEVALRTLKMRITMPSFLIVSYSRTLPPEGDQYQQLYFCDAGHRRTRHFLFILYPAPAVWGIQLVQHASCPYD